MKEFKSNRAYREECEAMRAQVAALTKERDMHATVSETRFEYLQIARMELAAMTNERNDLLILLDNWKVSQAVTEEQLAAIKQWKKQT